MEFTDKSTASDSVKITRFLEGLRNWNNAAYWFDDGWPRDSIAADSLATQQRIAALEADLDAAKQELVRLRGCRAELAKVRAQFAASQAMVTQLQDNRRVVEAGRDAAVAKAKSANDDANMYARAWQRELGPWMRPKRHHIDGCVLGTRELRAAAEDHTKPHCCGMPEYCTDHACAKLLRHRMGIDAIRARGTP